MWGEESHAQFPAQTLASLLHYGPGYPSFPALAPFIDAVNEMLLWMASRPLRSDTVSDKTLKVGARAAGVRARVNQTTPGSTYC